MNTFTGWPADAPALLAGIAADNCAERWDAHHEDALRAPVRALAADLGDEFGPIRVLRARVNRRFRPSAPPLRTDTGAIAGPPGGATLAVMLSATALTVTAGIFRFDAGQSRRYRAAVAGGVATDAGGGGDPGGGSGGGLGGGPGGDGGRDVHKGPGRDLGGGPGGVPGRDLGGGPGAGPGGDGGRDLGDGPGRDLGGDPGGDPGGPASADGPGRAAEPGSGDAGRGGPDRGADVEPGDHLARILLDLGLAGLVPDPTGELRGRPRGVPADHPRLALLRRRGLQVTRSWPVGPWLATPEPLDRVRAAWRSAAPLLAWLDTNVGPADPGR